ncbi:uncharacterized protein EDB93DRAFT_1110245 [Suillus bovinus]|uniref:uncharacterized protein n=1 Tax=Suillus bovinus TaxID=48563 RepID=UPI001B870607|nr:uncharacterized protein EDB93DRAFT_1110245 [Suillus bovinus]KAG2125352.1 hypothetical protein EDB93DRAFT_1110245 [Suillus bovinus]
MPPRTKQTCKKSTGGVAPRVTLNLPGAVSTISRVEVGTVRIEEEERRDHNNFCLVCRDGAVDDYHLFMCDLCPRTMCSNCLQITPRHQDVISGVGVTFVCISCHVLVQHHGCGSQNPYFGFYRDGKPVFDTFLQIHGALELSHQAQVSSETVLFIHLNLIDNDTTGGPFKLSHDFLLPYFPDGGIVFREVIFDVGSDSKIVKFHSMVNKLVLNLLAFPGGLKRIIFGVSDHTDNDFGDPFVGYKGKKKTYISTPVNTFLDIVLGPFKDLINLAVESYLWLFCCGAIVNNSESFENLKTSVLQHQLSASVAFNANSDSLNVIKFTWTHAVFRPWGQYLPVQCPKYWTSSFRAILVSYQSKFLAANSKSERSRVIKKIRKAIVVAHKEQGEQVPLPSSLKKAIKKYYGRKNDEEESDEEGAAKAREISARPKEASFYKKMLTDWDVAQRLFKQEMDEFDKAEQARKGVKDPIKFRTRHAREWFNQMSLTQKKEVDYAREKWNTEGAPEESQVIHESQPRNVKKSFSVSSDGIKEWTSTGFEFFAEWAKGEFYPTADQDDKEEEEHGLPELILDDEGYAQLPSRDGIRLKGQQELKFSLALYLAASSVPDNLLICDPSHMRSKDINVIWKYWESRSVAKKRLVSFIKARPMDMRRSKRDKASSRKVKPYDEVTSEEEQHSLAGLGATLAVVSPAEVPLDRRFEFLDGLSTDSSYLELVDAVKDLAKMTENISTPNEELELPPWVDWCCGESYLPEYLHGSQDMVMASLEYEEDEAPPGTPIYLASSIMDLQCMIKVDNAIRHTLCAIVGLIELAMKATSGDFDEGDQEEMKGVDGENVDKDEDKEEDKDEDEDKDKDEDEEEDEEEDEDMEEDKDQDEEDEQEEVTGDLDVQMQEVEKDNEQEQEAGKSKGKKRVRNQTSSVKTKKARIEDEPIRQSTRSRQPSRKNIL